MIDYPIRLYNSRLFSHEKCIVTKLKNRIFEHNGKHILKYVHLKNTFKSNVKPNSCPDPPCCLITHIFKNITLDVMKITNLKGTNQRATSEI